MESTSEDLVDFIHQTTKVKNERNSVYIKLFNIRKKSSTWPKKFEDSSLEYCKNKKITVFDKEIMEFWLNNDKVKLKNKDMILALYQSLY